MTITESPRIASKEALQRMQDLGHSDLSYSAIKALRQGGAHHFYRYKERELEDKKTPSLELGTMIDEYLLDRPTFDEKYILCTVETPSSENQRNFAHYVSNGVDPSEAYKRSYSNPPKTASKLAEKAQDLLTPLRPYIEYLPQSVGKIEYTEKESMALSQIKMNILGHKFLQRLFSYLDSPEGDHIEVVTKTELSGEIFGFPIHGELDMILIDHKCKCINVFDLKSTFSFLKNFQYQVAKFDYVLQAVIYRELAKGAVPADYKVKNPYIIPVRTTSPYDVGIYQITDDWLMQEYNKLKDDMILINQCYRTGQFKYDPDYYSGNGILALPFVKDEDIWKNEIEQGLS